MTTTASTIVSVLPCLAPNHLYILDLYYHSILVHRMPYYVTRCPRIKVRDLIRCKLSERAMSVDTGVLGGHLLYLRTTYDGVGASIYMRLVSCFNGGQGPCRKTWRCRLSVAIKGNSRASEHNKDKHDSSDTSVARRECSVE